MIAGVRTADGRGLAGCARRPLRSGDTARPAIAGNTTLGVIATNATLSKAQATKVAQMAQDGFGADDRPAHTPGDGDTIFALATGERSGEANVSRIGAAAADVMSQAILRASSRPRSAGYPPHAICRAGEDSGLFRRSIRTSRARPNTVVVCELRQGRPRRAALVILLGSTARVPVARTMLPCAPRRLWHVVNLTVPPADVVPAADLSDGIAALRPESSRSTTISIVFRSIADVVMCATRQRPRPANDIWTPGERARSSRTIRTNNRRDVRADGADAVGRGWYFGVCYVLPVPSRSPACTDRFSVRRRHAAVFRRGRASRLVHAEDAGASRKHDASRGWGPPYHRHRGPRSRHRMQGVTTVGSDDSAATIGFRRAYSGHGGRGILMIGGEHRQNPADQMDHGKLVLAWGGARVVSAAACASGRAAIGRSLSLVVPLVDDAAVAFPIVSFAWHF